MSFSDVLTPYRSCFLKLGFRISPVYSKLRANLETRGQKDFTLEQATDLCGLWGLNTTETEYFQKLVLISRAGNERTRQSLQAQLSKLRAEGNQVSTWIYSAARLATSLPEGKSIDAISNLLQLPATRIFAPVIEFLLEKGLCTKTGGRLGIGVQSTHLPASSPLVTRHHMNWRLNALERADRIQPEDGRGGQPLEELKRDLLLR